MLAPDPATRRAVEAHARAGCFGVKGDACDRCITPQYCTNWRTHWPTSVVQLAAYHASLGEDVRAARVERCANIETGEG
jgi:hypothetical protein